ncbi:MAG: GTP-binding protein, partial [Candidatus Heimdallarchaeota archaeon]|nr:GTP-binding protein [Candidatus Heimdallarchaeota archaeon]MCK4291491.1 GTP-binding protein [Candidatus Heimdallarchaeota archaeon]
MSYLSKFHLLKFTEKNKTKVFGDKNGLSFLRRLISADKRKGLDGGPAKQHVAIIGLDAAGKTTIMKRILRSEYTLSKPTFGVNIEVYRYRTLEFVVWDLGGHAPIRKTLWKKFVTKAQVIVFVVDAADKKRFNLAKDVFYDSLENTEPNAPILFLANKSDKEDAASSVEVMEALELQKMTRSDRAFNMFRCSALTGEGLFNAWDWLVDIVAKDKHVPTWHVKIFSAVAFDSNGKELDQAIFGNPTQQAKVATAYRESIKETERFAKQMRDYNEAVTVLEIMEDYQLVITKNKLFVLGILIDVNDPVSRVLTIASRIFDAIEMDYLKGISVSLEKVISNYFP